MSLEIRSVMPRLARQLLIRPRCNWTGEEARRIVKVTLAAMQVNLLPADMQKLVACTYRVGANLDVQDKVHQSVAWDVDELRTALESWLAQHDRTNESNHFIELIAGTIKSCDFSAQKPRDWVSLINRFLQEDACSGMSLALATKLAFAEKIEELLERRLDALVAYATDKLEVTVDEVVTALHTEADEYKPQTADRLILKQLPIADRLRNEEVDELAQLVHKRVQTDFRDWCVNLAPLAQRAVQRRMLQLQTEPLVFRLWVKSILGVRETALRELRVVSDGTHYRVLFEMTPDDRILVLSFGQRRDLETLIEKAITLARVANTPS